MCDQRQGVCYRTPGLWEQGQRRRADDRRTLPFDPAAGRFAQAGPAVTCDRFTSVCYKDGHLDKTETRAFFGRSAARNLDELRDKAGTGDVFVPRPGIVCNRYDRHCIEGRRDGR